MARITDSQHHQALDDLGRVRAENDLLADENGRLVAENSLLAAHVPGLEEGNRVLQERVDLLHERIGQLTYDVEGYKVELAQRDEDLQELSDLAAEKVVSAESQRAYLAQVLVAIAHYEGLDPTVPADIAFSAVRDFLPESE